MATAVGVSFAGLGPLAYLGALPWLVLPLVLLFGMLRNRGGVVGRVAVVGVILVELAFYAVLVGAVYGTAMPTRFEVLLLYGPLTLLLCGLARAAEWTVPAIGGLPRRVATRLRGLVAARTPRQVRAPATAPVAASIGGGPVVGEVVVGELVDERTPPGPVAPDPASQAYAAAIALGRPVRRLSTHLSLLATCAILICYYLFVGLLGARLVNSPDDPTLVLPLPPGLTLRGEFRHCDDDAGGRACSYVMHVAGPDGMTRDELVDRVREHLASRAWESGGEGQLCQRPGWFLRPQACLTIDEPTDSPIDVFAIITLG